ncbi:MAG: hypothetical protein ACYTF8_02565 [Planctomycetota bacterium]|jgi:hypothetical protein
MRFGKALRLEPGVDTGWALARVLLRDMDEVRTLLGKVPARWSPIAKLSEYVVGDSRIVFASRRAEEPGDPEVIEHVGRMWTERHGEKRTTYTHSYYFAGRKPRR